MIIELNTTFIKIVKCYRTQHPNNEIGFTIKKNSEGDIEFKTYKGKEHTVSMPFIKDCINMHTHPDHLDKEAKYSPPSGPDMTFTMFHTGKDSAVFDKNGVWIYRPDRALVRKINKKKKIIDGEVVFDKSFYNAMGSYTHQNCRDLIYGKTDLKGYLKDMRCFNIMDEDKEEIDKKNYGFIINYYPYDNLTSIKLYMDDKYCE